MDMVDRNKCIDIQIIWPTCQWSIRTTPSGADEIQTKFARYLTESKVDLSITEPRSFEFCRHDKVRYNNSSSSHQHGT